MSSSVCPHSGLVEENIAYHKLVRCTTFEYDRDALVRWIETCDLHDLVGRMLECPASWCAVVDFAEAVIEFKEKDDYARDNRKGKPHQTCMIEDGCL